MAFARPPQQQDSSNLIQLAVKGWASPPSKFAAEPESGVSAIVTFLEKKSQRKIHAHNVVGRRVLIISIVEADAPRFFHLNGFTFSGANLVVEEARSRPPHLQNQNGTPQTQHGPRSLESRIQSNPPPGPRSHQTRFDTAPSGPRAQQNNFQNNSPFGNQFNKGSQPNSQKQEIESVMVAVIHKRYNANEKYLTFESLAMDPDFQAAGLSQQPASKVFTALFTICEQKVFETPAKRREMVTSVSLSNNALNTVQDVIALSATFPQLQNLDLSNNNISDTGDMRFWRRAFRNLEHLILTGNPIDTKPPAKEALARWFPKLKLMNNQPLQPQSAAQMALDGLGGPERQPSPAQPPPTQAHPEFPEGSTFGLPQPGKPEDQLVKEQMGLKFSFETRLKMSWVEQCLVANNFNYDSAMADLQKNFEAGNVPADAFLAV